MGDDKGIKEKLNKTIEKAIRLIDVLYGRSESNKELLDEFKAVLLDYQENGDLIISRKLREIDSRPSKEGADTDFTTGTSLQFDGRYVSLQDLILEIEDLVISIESI